MLLLLPSSPCSTRLQSLFAEIDEAINNGSINDDEVAEYEKQIAALIVKLGIPAEADNASDTNPVDLTSCIKTPSLREGWCQLRGRLDYLRLQLR